MKKILVKEIMLNLNQFPIVDQDELFRESIEEMNKFGLGIACIVDSKNKLKGILTDGDIRRLILRVQKPLAAIFVDETFNYSTTKFTSLNESTHLNEAVTIMERHKIWDIPITDKNGTLKGIEPDSKSQVTMLYEEEKPIKVTSVVISTQHSKDLNQDQVRDLIIPYIKKSVPSNYLKELKDEEIYINPTGQFIIGGPDGDTGLTGRKIIVDTYGGAAPHGGGAFSGKDPTKVDRSAAYASRYLAKNIVSSGISDKCLIQLAYAIGVSKPLSVFIKLANGDETKIETVKKIIDQNFDLSPRGIREMLKLNRPIYEVTSAYGHFGRKPTDKGEFSWEKTDKVDLFKR